MTEEKKNEKENPVIEKLEAAGQIIIGELEKIGGIITADPLTQAEGDFNIEAGIKHREIIRKDSETSDDPSAEETS